MISARVGDRDEINSLNSFNFLRMICFLLSIVVCVCGGGIKTEVEGNKVHLRTNL